MRFRVGSKGARARVGSVVGASLLLVLACSREQPPGPPDSDEQPVQITRNFTTTETDKAGAVRYELRAQVARRYDDGVTKLETLEVDFFDEGRKSSVLRSREGFRDADGRMRARGNVVVTAVEGGVLETDELYWDRERGKIRTDGAFKITDKGDVLTGIGLTTTPNLDLVEIDRDMTGIGRENPQPRQ